MRERWFAVSSVRLRRVVAVGLLGMWVVVLAACGGGAGSSDQRGGGGTSAGAEVARGRELYMAQGCNACHTLDGSASAGPTWKGLWGSRVALEGGGEVTADEAYIKESIREPNAKVVKGFPPTMPSFTNLSDEDVAAIVALIRSLGSDGSGH